MRPLHHSGDRHCERSDAIQQTKKLSCWIASSQAPRNDAWHNSCAINTRRWFWLAATLVLLITAGVGHAATVSSEKHRDYQRLNFAFPSATKLSVSNEKNRVVLRFNQPVNAPLKSIQTQLGTAVTAVTQSKDKKTLTLTLKSPARVRQFTSGNTTGVDIFAAAETPPPSPLSTKPSTAKPDTMFSTKKERAPIPFKKPLVIAPPRAPVAKAVPVAPVEQAEAVAPTKASAPPAAVAAEKPSEVAPKQKQFAVTVRKTKVGAVLNFPWKERTAAAVFERPRAIWIIFSREAEVNTAQLLSVMPKQIVKVQQYQYPGALVLRLATNGALHAVSEQSGKNYEWNVTLDTQLPNPALDTPISIDTSGEEKRLMFGAYDVSKPLQFYDPVMQDRILAVPTFELGRGIQEIREYPEFTVLPTQQGIVLIAQRDDITIEALRQGIRLSAKDSLTISKDLPVPSDGSVESEQNNLFSTVMLPYDRWFVDPHQFANQRAIRLRNIANANSDAMPTALMQLVALYLGQGMGAEAHGYLALIKHSYPSYYEQHKLAMLSAAGNVLMHRFSEAADDIAAKELDEFDEALMWREFIAMLSPPKVAIPQAATASTEVATAVAAVALVEYPPFDFTKYNKPYIRLYPPRVRQKMAQLTADRYVHDGKESKALAVYDTLTVDGVMGSLESEGELILASIAVQKGKTKEAGELYARLSKEGKTPRAVAVARFQDILLRHAQGKLDLDKAIEAIELLRLSWRGDEVEHDMLMELARLYSDAKRYDGTLRTWKAVLEAFPSHPEYIRVTGDMAELFENLFRYGKADEMSPLKSLALFYEFRELTPIGERGDAIIQKLADRLAAVDLLDRATQLLENQVRFRVSGEQRARIGARLALLYLLNQEPEKALSTIEITNFSDADKSLLFQRNQIAAKALSALNKHEDALGLLSPDKSPEGNALRLEILWAAKDWANVINQAEDILSARPNLTAQLTMPETEVLLKLVLGYNFVGDRTQLKYLRDYYTGLIPESAYQQIFDYLTNDTTPLDTEDYKLVINQINRTESFLGKFKQQIAQGKLSETVK